MSRSFGDELEDLKKAWLGEEVENESPEELGMAVMDFILRRERLRHGVHPGTPEASELDRRTRETLNQPDVLDPTHSLFEAFIGRLARNPEMAINYLTKFVENRSAQMAKVAQQPRPGRRDGITVAIYDCLESNPKASAKTVGKYLRDHPDIELADGIYSYNRDKATMREGLLDSRVNSAKNNLRKNSG